MPKAVKYVLVPFAEYSDLLKWKKQKHSITEPEASNPLKKAVNRILNNNELTDYEKINHLIKKVTDLMHQSLVKNSIYKNKEPEQHKEEGQNKMSSRKEIGDNDKQVTTESDETPPGTPEITEVESTKTHAKPYPLKRLKLDLPNDNNLSDKRNQKQEKPEENKVAEDNKTDSTAPQKAVQNIATNTQTKLQKTTAEISDTEIPKKRLRRDVKNIRKDWLYY